VIYAPHKMFKGNLVDVKTKMMKYIYGDDDVLPLFVRVSE
jgi:hypothetical protein